MRRNSSLINIINPSAKPIFPYFIFLLYGLLKKLERVKKPIFATFLQRPMCLEM